MIPADVTPRWRDVPALAWLAAGAFGMNSGRGALAYPARAALWPVQMMTMTMAHAQRGLAAYRRDAIVVLTARPAPHRGRGVLIAGLLGPLALAATLAPAVAVTMTGYLFIVVGMPRLGIVIMACGPVVALAQLVMIIAGVRQALYPSAIRELLTARRHVRRQYSSVIEASTLAAVPGTGAATPLVRRLLEYADEHQLAIVAYARDDRLAQRYRRLGFTPALPDARRALHRRPRRYSPARATAPRSAGRQPKDH